jgi:hypothetical protein
MAIENIELQRDDSFRPSQLPYTKRFCTLRAYLLYIEQV